MSRKTGGSRRRRSRDSIVQEKIGAPPEVSTTTRERDSDREGRGLAPTNGVVRGEGDVPYSRDMRGRR